MKRKKLVLFDIDGTLIYHVGRKTSWEQRYTKAMQDTYGVRVSFDPPLKHEGSIERKIAWDELSPMGIDRQSFDERFPQYIARRMKLFNLDANVEPLYRIVPEARALVQTLSEHPRRYVLGVLTGNAQPIAGWKLSHAGYSNCFRFGLYGDEADNRIALARLVFEKAKKEFAWRPAPKDIVVIGDTVHDIRCGKAIGAVTIAVTTGMHGDRTVLEKEHPDLIVDSLMDERVLGLLGLKE